MRLTIREGRIEHPDVVVVADEVTALTELVDPQRIVEAVRSGRLRLQGKAEDVGRVQRVFGLAAILILRPVAYVTSGSALRATFSL